MIGMALFSGKEKGALSKSFVLVFGFFCSLCACAQTPSVSPSKGSPADLPALRNLIDKGKVAEALQQLDVLAQQQPEPVGVERLRGMAFYTQGNFAAADRALSAALQQDSKDTEAAEIRGLTLFRLGRPAEAIPILETVHGWNSATKIDPDYVLALCYIETRRFEDARRALARQYGFAPESAEAYLIAARILLRRENLLQAKELAQKAISLNSQLPLAHLLLGEIALSGERLDEAIAEFEKERAQNPLYGGVYDRLGDAYSRAGDYPKAQQALQRALLLEPYATGPYILLGKVLLRREDPVSAATYLERAEKMDPSNYLTHNFLSQAYRLMGKTVEAAKEAALAKKLQEAERPRPNPD